MPQPSSPNKEGASFESSLTIPASATASYVSTSSLTRPWGKVACIYANLRFPLVVQPPQLEGPRQSVGVHHSNLRGQNQYWPTRGQIGYVTPAVLGVHNA